MSPALAIMILGIPTIAGLAALHLLTRSSSPSTPSQLPNVQESVGTGSSGPTATLGIGTIVDPNAESTSIIDFEGKRTLVEISSGSTRPRSVPLIEGETLEIGGTPSGSS